MAGRAFCGLSSRPADGADTAEPMHEQIVRAWAPNHTHAGDLIRRALVLLADHEFNASTFTVRCAASTGFLSTTR